MSCRRSWCVRRISVSGPPAPMLTIPWPAGNSQAYEGRSSRLKEKSIRGPCGPSRLKSLLRGIGAHGDAGVPGAASRDAEGSADHGVGAVCADQEPGRDDAGMIVLTLEFRSEEHTS